MATRFNPAGPSRAMASLRMNPSHCVVCGEPITDERIAQARRTVACSAECAEENRLARKREWAASARAKGVSHVPRTRDCIMCGERIVNRKPWALTCSHTCGRELSNQRSREWQARKAAAVAPARERMRLALHCAECGTRITVDRPPNAVTCSTDCSKLRDGRLGQERYHWANVLESEES